MASMKAERTVSPQVPKEPAKAADSTSKASKPGPKKAEQKPQPKRKAAPKAKGGKPAAAKN